MNLKHVMIDLETMGITPDSAIVSIGAVLFDPRVNKVSSVTFYRELDWVEQDRVTNKETQAWWNKQSAKAKEALDGLDDLDSALIDLSKWLPKDCKVWGNGPTFDIVMLENAYRQYGLEIPWKYWNVRDCRTIKDLYESSRGGFGKGSTTVAHNALDDAIAQALSICSMWRKIL